MKPPILVLFVLLCCNICTRVAYAQASFFDPSFGVGGMTIIPFAGTEGGLFEAITVQPDGKILAAANFNGKATIVRFKENGMPDTSFAVNGIYSGPLYTWARDIIMQPDGKILIEGTVPTPETPLSKDGFYTSRINSNGTLDLTFGIGGSVALNFFLGNETGYAIALQADNKIVVAGDINGKAGLARLMPNGTIDNTFDSDGVAILMDGKITGVDVAPDGKIVAGGIFYPGDKFLVLRMSPDGTLDTSFNHTGYVASLVGDSWNYAGRVKTQIDGKILITGSGTFGSLGSDFVAMRYNLDGSIDGGFGSAGIVHLDFNSKGDRARAIALTGDNKIMLAGEVAINDREDFGIVRLNSDGSIDNSFGAGGKIVTSVRDNDDEPYAVALQADGRIVLAGKSYRGTFPNNYYDPVIARFLPNSVGINDLDDIHGNEPLYPNPTNGILLINEVIAKKISKIDAKDMTGIEKEIGAVKDGRIEISGWTNGLYMFRIQQNDGSIIMKKVLVQN